MTAESRKRKKDSLPMVYPRLSSLHRGLRCCVLATLCSFTASPAVVLATGEGEAARLRGEAGVRVGENRGPAISTDWDFCFSLGNQEHHRNRYNCFTRGATLIVILKAIIGKGPFTIDCEQLQLFFLQLFKLRQI